MKKLLTLFALVAMAFSAGFAQTCDTLFNLQSPLDTPILYYADTGSSPGYVGGNNVYGDLAKAEGFPAVIGDSVYSALLYFGVVVINPSPVDSNSIVTIAVWDNTGTSWGDIYGAPGNIIDTAQVTLRQIAQVVTSAIYNQTFEGVLVNFTQHAVLTTDTFYVGVILPTTLGNSVALYTNEVPPGMDGNGWELESGEGNAWGSYTDDWSAFSGGGLGDYIAVGICSSAASTGIITLNNQGLGALKVYPNPASDQVNFEWSLNDEADVMMYDITGNMVKSFTIQGLTLSNFDVHDLASGAYIIRVTDRQTNEQRSTLFTKL